MTPSATGATSALPEYACPGGPPRSTSRQSRAATSDTRRPAYAPSAQLGSGQAGGRRRGRFRRSVLEVGWGGPSIPWAGRGAGWGRRSVLPTARTTCRTRGGRRGRWRGWRRIGGRGWSTTSRRRLGSRSRRCRGPLRTARRRATVCAGMREVHPREPRERQGVGEGHGERPRLDERGLVTSASSSTASHVPDRLHVVRRLQLDPRPHPAQPHDP